MLLYTTAAPFQNMPVKPVKAIPLQVLATSKLDKSPPWSEWRPWDGTVAPGYFHSDDLAGAREYLHTQGLIPKVAVTHKRELRKEVVELDRGRMVLAREPAHAYDVASFCAHFGLEYRGASLCAAVGSVMEKLLKPKRLAIF